MVGAGPAGFYIARRLLELGATVDLFERRLAPFGLLRTGVAPDHVSVKQIAGELGTIGRSAGFRYRGGVAVGADLPLATLRTHWDQVVVAVGASRSRTVDLPGSDLPGVFTAEQLVGWYGGDPEHVDHVFPLDGRDLVVVGMGNVALDLARVLASPPGRFADTDISDVALGALQDGRPRRVHVLGRRGPLQARCTPRELQTLISVDGLDVRVRQEEAALDPLSQARLARHSTRTERSLIELVGSRTGRRWWPSRREVWLRFQVSPVAFLGEEGLEAVRVVHNELVPDAQGRLVPRPTGRSEEIPARAAFLALGSDSVGLPGLPAVEGRIRHRDGQVLGPAGPVPDLYAAGWCATGAHGLVGMQRRLADTLVDRMLADPVIHPADPGDPLERVRLGPHVDWADWERIDAHERALGAAAGRSRVKLSEAAMWELLRSGS